MNTPNELQTLTERRDYLKKRIEAKKSVGWETQYDERECWALTWAITRMEYIEQRNLTCLVMDMPLEFEFPLLPSE